MKKGYRLLSLLLCALILLNMIPMSVWASEAKEKPHVAQRSSSYAEYDTLKEALEAVVISGETYEIQSDESNPASNTITLTNDTTISGAISLGNEWEITLDLNGYTLDCSGDDVFALSDTPSNTHIILKNGTLTNANNFMYTLPSECSLTILDGTYTLSGSLVNELYGQLRVEDGTFTCGHSFVSDTYGSGEVLIQDGTFDASEGRYGFDNIAGQVTIQNGTFLATDDLFYFTTDNYSHGTVLVEDGSFTSHGDLFFLKSGKNARLTVNGGTFTVQESEDYSSGNLLYLHSGAVAEINGGTFAMEQENTAIMVDESSVLNINNGSFPPLVLYWTTTEP